MAIPTLIAAVLLVAVGTIGYANQDPAKVSGTALIPAYIGIALGICGLLALKSSLRKHAMHAASMLALLGGCGALIPTIIKLAKGNEVNFSAPAVVSQLLTTAICFTLLAMCVNSFIQIRKARRASANHPA
jgi:hypothetical protein